MIGSVFQCNICGADSVFNPEGDWREAPSCETCGSSVRMRGIIDALLERVTGKSQVLSAMEPRPLCGAGLSDWTGYADRLASIFDYTNTFYHQDPRVDITAPGEAWLDRLDFLISSDVFEHVPVPVERAFSGSFAMLRSGGILILTAPYGDDEATVEHYPDMQDFAVAQVAGDWVVVVRNRDGSTVLDTAPVFHGGPGTTLEMRVFGLAHLAYLLAEVGFVDIKLHEDAVPQWGVFQPHRYGLPISARKP